MRPGERVGEFELLAELGRGGGGVVFRARSVHTGEVALKLQLDTLTQTELQRRRFVREGRALARLRHAHVLTVHEAGEADGRPYLVTELIAGQSLQQRLAQTGPLTPRQAVELTWRLADALAHAHALGVLHRDLKPENVLLREGRLSDPVLIDFGLARELVTPEGSVHATRPGQLLGTPGFWAPEMAKGEVAAVGPWTDVYGLGSLLVTLLTGEPPHGHPRTLQEALDRASRPPPPPSARAPAVDRALDAICLRALEVEPARRWSDAHGLRDALRQWLDRGRPRRLGRRGRAAVGLGAVALLVGAGVLAGNAWQTPGPTGGATPAQEVATPPTSSTPADELARLEEQLAARPNDLELLLALARAHVQAGQEHRGLEALDRAVAAHPGDARPLVARSALRRATSANDAAVVDAQRAVALDERSATTRAELGLALLASNSDLRAATEVETALRLDPRCAPALIARALLLARDGRRQEAVAELDRAVDLDPTQAEGYMRRAFFATERGPAANLADLDRCLELEPIHGHAFHTRAELRLAAGDARGALADCDAALPRTSSLGRVLLCRARCWQDLGEPQRALADLDQLLALPDNATSVERQATALRRTLRALAPPGG